MRKRILLGIMFFLVVLNSHGQGENNIWSFGRRYSLDFNTTPPLLKDTLLITGQPAYTWNPPLIGGVTFHTERIDDYKQSIVVCDPNGQPQFMVRLHRGVASNVGIPGAITDVTPCIYDSNYEPIPGTHLMNTLEAIGPPIVVPHPGISGQYYIFYCRGHGLLYSLFDMNLNNGRGGIVPGQHNVLIGNYNTISGLLMTSVRGCTGVWLVVRKRDANGYLSYLVDRSGIHIEPVFSEIGSLPTIGSYNLDGGSISPSPDGRTLAVGIREEFGNPHSVVPDTLIGGLELYDFELCSGKLSNPRILDTGYYWGTCFSPDGSKLYATECILNPLAMVGINRLGFLVQYDLNQPTFADIITSKTLIIENPYIYLASPFCPRKSVVLGDIKAGPDNKLYLLNHSPPVCFGIGMAFHIIEQPNNPGLACNPVINALYYSTNGMFAEGPNTHIPDRLFLPRDIVTAPDPPDTLVGEVMALTACFTDSFHLSAREGFECYRWKDSASGRDRVITEPGTYWVSYFRDCSIMVDTYNVTFIELPQVPELKYGCPGDIGLEIKQPHGSTSPYSYALTHLESGRSANAVSDEGYDFEKLQPGSYTLQITTQEGCDTTMEVHLESYPVPELVTEPRDTIIRYGDTIQLRVSGADDYTWSPGFALDQPKGDTPFAFPAKPTTFTVIGMNGYGCRDTAEIHMDIDYHMPDLVPNAFSPNGDGLNDIFKVEGFTFQHLKAFRVFNRYGTEVFYTINPKTGWDGTFNGKPCDVGTYFYMVELAYPDGRQKVYKGEVHLLR